jgi:hypothetical protein
LLVGYIGFLERTGDEVGGLLEIGGKVAGFLVVKRKILEHLQL